MCGESIRLYYEQWGSKYVEISTFARLCLFCSESKCHFFFAFSTLAKVVKAVTAFTVLARVSCLLMQQMRCVRTHLQDICAKKTRYPTRRNTFHLLGFGPFCVGRHALRDLLHISRDTLLAGLRTMCVRHLDFSSD